jgi:hypothetical protein
LLAGLETKLGFSPQYIEPARYLPVLGLLALGSISAAALHYRTVERRFLAMRGPRPFLENSRAVPVAPHSASQSGDRIGAAADTVPRGGRVGLERRVVSD